MSPIIPPGPPVPTPGSSPLVERIHPDTHHIEITPAFGARLHLVLHTNAGMPEAVEDSVSAVTVYGDGRIEYHVDPADEPAPYLPVDGAQAEQADPDDDYEPALPWAAVLHAGDRRRFLVDLEDAVLTFHQGGASDAEMLRRVETVCTTWRLIAEAQCSRSAEAGDQ